ncbi:MAG: hypothetical protein GY891_07030 [Bacteroidetes bacterium]|nr:hypothetical protein [Bacteroidota bacterium]
MKKALPPSHIRHTGGLNKTNSSPVGHVGQSYHQGSMKPQGCLFEFNTSEN